MKKKPLHKMTIEKLAQMSQREFLSIHGEIGEFRGEVKEKFERVHEDNRILRRDMEAGFSAVSESMKTVIEKLNDIQKDVIEIHDLRGRVERLEKKVGFAR
ncbi:MAG: hypothetical protein HY433_00990 [Candidatus Liptonbacteria bacterium]|nr:hypothetical protein [Candidatus Liptonbacteria bacterium]